MGSDNLPRQNSLDLGADLFLTAKRSEGVSRRTLQAYELAVGRFVTWLELQGISEPAAVTPHLVRRYLVELGAKKYTSATVHAYTRPIKTMLRFWHAEGLVPENIFAKVAMPKLARPVLPAFSADDITKLLNAATTSADPLRDRAIIAVLIDTGIRAAELCDLTMADVDARSGVMVVRNGKGGKGRSIFLGPTASKAVLRFLMERGSIAAEDPLFPSLSTGEPLTPNSLFLLCRRLGIRAGVEHCHPHTFRRTFAIWSLRSGMDIFRLAKLMGHSDVGILKQYLDISADDLSKAHDDFGALENILKAGRGRRTK